MFLRGNIKAHLSYNAINKLISSFGIRPMEVLEEKESNLCWRLSLNQRLTIIILLYSANSEVYFCCEVGIGLVSGQHTSSINQYILSFKDISLPVRLVLRPFSEKNEILCASFRSPANLINPYGFESLIRSVINFGEHQRDQLFELGLRPLPLQRGVA